MSAIAPVYTAAEAAFFARFHEMVGRLNQEEFVSLGATIERAARDTPDRVMIYFEDRTWAFRQANEEMNQLASLLLSRGYRKGEVVAIAMENCAHYLLFIGGLNKIGCVAALINIDQRGPALVHALAAASPRALIVDTQCLAHFEPILAQTNLDAERVFHFRTGENEATRFLDLRAALAVAPATNPPTTGGNRRVDRCVLMYSSGTTGLPKAIWWDNGRFLYQGRVFDLALELTPHDVIFAPTPLYHNLATGLAWSTALCDSRPLIITRRFSASGFWRTAARHGATLGWYIGEIPRYLLAQPPSAADRSHHVRKMVGAGLRKEIWLQFKERFGIEDIFEFYGQSETPGSFFNLNRVPGMVGRLLPDTPLSILRYDAEREEFLRGPDGLCMRCEPGEAGMVVAIPAAGHRMFYVDSGAVEPKLVRDVFTRGDCYVVTGDLLRCHDDHYVSFEDRLGATFRWKGHNVSTQEVETILALFEGICVACVFGVKVPDADGSVGMAAIQRRGHVPWDWAAFERFVLASLPRYAVPAFIRFQDRVETTGGTFKVTKVTLKRQGFDPRQVTEPLFYWDAKQERYRPLDRPAYEKIQAGELRF